jgi:uncharacterized membrane protein
MTDETHYPESPPHRYQNTLGVMHDARLTRVIGGALAILGWRLPLPLRVVTVAVGGYLALTGKPTVHQMTGEVSDTLGHQSHLVIEKAVTIHRPLRAVYQFLRDFTTFPLYLKRVRAVEALDDTGDHWYFELDVPSSDHREWYIRLTDVREEHLIAWHSLPQSRLDTRGSIRFREVPERNGVEVRLTIAYQPGSNPIARRAASVANALIAQGVKEAMMRFKQVLETGEYPRTEGQPHGEAQSA